MLARVRESRNALELRSVAATDREFNVLRTAVVLTALSDVLPGVERTALPREVGPAAERDIAGLAPT